MDLTAIKEFVDNYINQDNCGTAWPYYYVLQQRRMMPVPDGCGDIDLYHSSGWDIHEKTREEMLAIIHEEEPDFEGEPEDHEGVEKHDHVEIWEDEQSFFTKAELDRHLERNGHNYRRPVRPYVKYYYRNTEAKLLLKTMFELAGKDFDEEAKMLSKRKQPTTGAEVSE